MSERIVSGKCRFLINDKDNFEQQIEFSKSSAFKENCTVSDIFNVETLNLRALLMRSSRLLCGCGTVRGKEEVSLLGFLNNRTGKVLGAH